MKKMLRVLTSWYVLGAVGLALLVLLIYLVGEWWDWPAAAQLGAVAGVLLLAVAALGVAYGRATRRASEIQASIAAQADEQQRNTRPDRRPEIEELKQTLNAAIETLKRSKLGRGPGGKAALYALPWYMVIGPPGAGKTSAIAHSGLSFPLGVDRVSGVGGTRNCDWFFSDQAILLDTAGRYMTEHDDTDEWHAFLDTLKENRAARPVNGAIVGISAADLAGANPDDVEWHATRIRRRIDELVERLGVRFPVYLVFTKCDLLQGFVEFFDDLTRAEREQVWGYTLPQDTQDETPVSDVFDREFDRLVGRLQSRRAHKLSRTVSARARQQAYLFPQEVSAIKDALARFVEQLFQPNPFQESPICRGFYFTSGTQEGTPTAHAGRAVAEALPLAGRAAGEEEERPAEQGQDDRRPLRPEPGREAYNPDRRTKAYFLKDLFTDVIVPDRFMVQRTSKASRRTWMTQAAVAVGALALVATFVLGASSALVQSQRQIAAVQASATAVNQAGWGPAQAPDAFAALDRLRAQVDTLAAYRDDPPLLRWGLRRDATLHGPARDAYLQAVRRFVQDDPLPVLRARLLAATEADVLRRAEREALYGDLRAYMLLTTDHNRLQNKVEQAFLREHLSGTARAVSERPATEQDALRERVAVQVEELAAALGAGGAAPLAGDRDLVERVRTLIYEPPSIDRLYVQIKEEGAARIPKLTLDEMLEGRYLELFATRPAVSGVFTREGYDRFVKDAIARETALPDQIDWVMGYRPEDLPASMKNQEEVAEALRALYFSEYASAWAQFVDGLELARFGSVRAAARSLNDLGNAYDSPLIYVLGTASYQTALGASALDAVAERAATVGTRAVERQTRRLFGRAGRLEDGPGEAHASDHPVDRRFRWLHDLNVEATRSGEASAAFTDVLKAMSEVSSVLDEMASDHGRAAAYAARVLEPGSGTEVEEALEAVRDAMRRVDPSARARLFDAPLLDAWRRIVRSAQQHVNERWRLDVYQPFQARLAGRYPFALEGPREVPVSDFEAFFKPHEGTVAQFRARTLAPFLEEGRTTARTWQGIGLYLAPATRAALERADRMGALLFEGGVVQVDFELQADQPETRDTSPPTSRVFVEAHGRSLAYDMGNYRPWTRFGWPGGAGALLRVATRDGELTPRRAAGAWAWFRLLQQADVQRTTPTQYVLRWPMDEGVTPRFLLRTDDADLPLHDLPRLFRYDCPPRIG
jgi:type VI secretion system protein ImpL